MASDGEPVVEGHTSAVFPFARQGTFEDEEDGVAVHMCGIGRCMNGDSRVLCFHDDCYQARLHPVTAEFMAATEYQFSPSTSEVAKRRHRIRMR